MNTSDSKLSFITTLIKPENDIEVHSAEWILVNPWHIIKNGYIKVENRIITEVSGENAILDKADSDFIVEHGEGLLMPPLINAHTHLELSYLKNKLCLSHDIEHRFEKWVRELLEQREKADEKFVTEQAEKAVHDLYNAGVLYLGEISTTGITKEIFRDSHLKGVWFNEVIGSDIVQNKSFHIDEAKMNNCSVAGHAPHTTSPDLMKYMKKSANDACLPFSIHVDESMVEKEFIETGKGQWANFLKERRIDFSSWNLPQKSPVVHLNNNGLLDPLTLMVHVLNSGDEDLKIISESGAKVCVCPRSNMKLHGKLPQIKKMMEIGIKPALGTDSLASCDSLSIFDEMKYITEHYKNIAPEELIAMATQFGADALGLGEYAGSLDKGKRSDMLYIPLKAKTETGLLEQIIGYE
jgi:aminodeoxyfutalosine deaminase